MAVGCGPEVQFFMRCTNASGAGAGNECCPECPPGNLPSLPIAICQPGGKTRGEDAFCWKRCLVWGNFTGWTRRCICRCVWWQRVHGRGSCPPQNHPFRYMVTPVSSPPPPGVYFTLFCGAEGQYLGLPFERRRGSPRVMAQCPGQMNGRLS
jgi:hypothetical protein